MRICQISAVVYAPDTLRQAEKLLSFTRQRHFSLGNCATASPLLFERDYQVALNYLNMPLIIAITNTIVAMTKPQKIAISDISLARATALRNIFP